MNKEIRFAQKIVALRKDGLSIGAIQRKTGATKHFVSKCIRDYAVTPERRAELRKSLAPRYGDNAFAVSMLSAGTFGIRERAAAERLEYQESGRRLAKKNNPLHRDGCMLYWCKGVKKRNHVKFVSGDMNIMRHFVDFLRECYEVEDTDFHVEVECHTTHLEYDDILEAWYLALGLERAKFINSKSRVDHAKGDNNNNQRGKNPYGTCTIYVYDVSIAQSIYGAIQEYSGVDNEAFLWYKG